MVLATIDFGWKIVTFWWLTVFKGEKTNLFKFKKVIP